MTAVSCKDCLADGIPGTRKAPCVDVTYRCEVCKAKAGQDCTNPINPGQPLPGRQQHFARALAPDDTAQRRKAKSA